MAAYMNTITKEYPCYPGDLELLGWVQGDTLPENWVEVLEVELPAITEHEKLTIGFPVKKDGKWYTNPVVTIMTDEEYAENVQRIKDMEKSFKPEFLP